jgi:hypothetical protein
MPICRKLLIYLVLYHSKNISQPVVRNNNNKIARPSSYSFSEFGDAPTLDHSLSKVQSKPKIDNLFPQISINDELKEIEKRVSTIFVDVLSIKLQHKISAAFHHICVYLSFQISSSY